MHSRILKLKPTSLNVQTVYLSRKCGSISQVKYYSLSSEYSQQLKAARSDAKNTLEKYDRSSLILSAYVPEPARDIFIATRAFNVEIMKITNKNNSASIGGLSSMDLRFKFWMDFLSKVFRNPKSTEKITEPSMFLLRDSLRNNINLNIDYFSTLLNSRKHWLDNPGFQSIDNICSYGEGTYSQLIYLEQSALLSENISPSTIRLLELSPNLQNLISDIAAHIGQANSIASVLLSLKYYARKEIIPLPTDEMAHENLSEDSLIEYINELSARNKDFKKDHELEEKLKNIIFKISTRANDHLLTSRYKFDLVKKEIKTVVEHNKNDELLSKFSTSWKRGIPDVIFVPFMNSVPVNIFIHNLEKKNFDILDERLTNGNWNRWKVVWNSLYNYNTRKI